MANESSSSSSAGARGPTGNPIGNLLEACRTWFWFAVARSWKAGRYRIQERAWRGITGRYRVRDRYGYRYDLDLDEFIDCHIFLNGTFEGASIEEIRRLAGETRANGFVDVGAYNGVFSLPMAGHPGIARVWTFEADPDNYRRLERNIEMNDLVGRVIPYHVAVTSAEGEAALHISDARKPINEFKRNRGTSSLRLDPDRHTRSVCVRTARLDDLLAVEGWRLVVKIDVERNELEALKGMVRLLNSNDCAIHIEIFPELMAEVDAWLGRHGYARDEEIRLEVRNYIYRRKQHDGQDAPSHTREAAPSG